MSNFGENQLVCKHAFDAEGGRMRFETLRMTQSTRRVGRFSTSATASCSFSARWSRSSRRRSASARNSETAAAALASTSSVCDWASALASFRRSSRRSSFSQTSFCERSFRSFCSSSTFFCSSARRLNSESSSSRNSDACAAEAFRNSSMLPLSSFRCATNASAASRPHRSMPAWSSALTAPISCSSCPASSRSPCSKVSRTAASTCWSSPESFSREALNFSSTAGNIGSSSVLTVLAQPWACCAASAATRSVACLAASLLASCVCDSLPNSSRSSVRKSEAAFRPAFLAPATSFCNC
mmetsp:Transcript_15196/g.43766  ORF Transcript_15196/g.43766 Transcript_15196/m.43766 type:complete len:298 (-) Transcript_15196:43-936(-)